MRGAEFKRLARQGVKSYGDDPWFFLRELAQNSRDAGARSIRVSAYRDADRETLVFSDDGRGMAQDHAERFLFRLYASSKESERSAAGMYGIGFWTVLGFEPDQIEVASRIEEEGWALRLDEDLSAQSAACDLAGSGTRVTLARSARPGDAGSFRDEVRAGLHRYCRYLRRNDRSSSVLPVDLDGIEINEPIRAGGPAELRFREGAVEGAVGLADAPRVELYARGLPVWEGMLLEELSHNPPPVQSVAGLETGLSPVFVLNGNDLRVVMDRNAVVDDKALRRLRRRATRALRRLVREQLDGLSGRGAFPRLKRLMDRLRYRKLGAVLGGILALAMIVGSIFLWEGETGVGEAERGLRGSARPGERSPRARGDLPLEDGSDTSVRPPLTDLAELQNALAAYDGAVVEDAPGDDHLSLTWSPAGRAWFRLSAAEDFDPARGFMRNPPPPRRTRLPPATCSERCLHVRLPATLGGPVPLPMPTGWGLVPGSLRIDGEPPPTPPTVNRYGEAVLELPDGGGIIEWSCAAQREDLTDSDRDRLLDLADATFPPELEGALRAVEALPVEERVQQALGLTRTLVHYEAGGGPRPALPADLPWVHRVLERGSGDCDVINGLTVLALRRLGVPARLAIGFVGAEGRLRPGLHAWTEFHLGGWQAVDVSAPAATLAASEGTNEAAAGGEVTAALPIGERSVPPYPRPVLVAASRPPRPSATPPLRRGGSTLPTATDETVDTIGSSPSRGEVPETSTASRRGRGRDVAANAFLAVGLTSGAAALLIIFILLARRHRRRSWRRLEGERSPEAMDRVLGRMALAWSVRPDLWGAAGFSLAPLLPRIGGGRISLERALHLADHGRLFVGSPGNPLATAPRRGVVVLDGTNSGFASFLQRIPGAVDLDPIQRAAPLDPADADGPVALLVAAVNRVLAQLGEEHAHCRIAPELGAGGLRDVDLSRLGRRGNLPARFVAVDPDAPLIREAVRIRREQPAVAIYRVVEWLSHRSTLPRRSPAQLRRGAARRTLEGMG